MLIQEARDKIRTTQLVKRLENHVLGKVKMAQTQVNAALGLLKKSLPDLQAVQHTGKDGGPIETKDVTRESIEREVAEQFADVAGDQADSYPVVH